MLDIKLLFKAIEKELKPGWTVQGISWATDPHVQFIKPNNESVSYAFVENANGITFTSGPLKNKDIIVNA